MSLAILRTESEDFEIIEAELILPLIATPTYYVTIDGDTVPAGKVEILFASGHAFVGTVARGVGFEGRVFLVIVGGSGGLSGEPEVRTTLEAAGYTGTPLVAAGDLLVGDIMTAAGESLADDAAELLETLSLPRWQRVAGLARHALGALARAFGVSWRVRPDGLVWLGAETFDDYADKENVIVQADSADTYEIRCALRVDRPDLQPGITFAGRRVVGVTYLLGENLRARLRYESSAGGSTLSSALEAALGPTAGIYAGSHVARVIEANADGTLDLLPDNEAVGARTGIASVPLRMGIYGAKQVLEEGASVVLRFGSSALFPCGDPALPFCEAITQHPDADRGIARVGDETQGPTINVANVVLPGPLPALSLTFVPATSPFGTPGGGTPIQVIIPGGQVIPSVDSIPLDGWIITGSPEIMLRKAPTEEIP